VRAISRERGGLGGVVLPSSARGEARWDLPEAEIDFAADRTVDVIASVPVLVVLLVIADATRGADAGGAS
jgi:hypothetical protein